MTLEEKYQLSCYQEITRLQDEKEIYLVKHIETGELYIKKVVEIYSRSVYQSLMEYNINNIPRIFLLLEDNDKLIVIEEYIHGDSLDKILKEKGLMREEQVVEMIAAVCDILADIHGKPVPIVHRDVKPSNIMISKDGIIKLVDFNAAKEYETGKNEDTRLIGTQDFAAPEQYGFGQSSPKTDIYALGVTINYLLTGDYPKNQLWDGKLKSVIEKCTKMNPEERYENISQLKQALFHYSNYGRDKRNDLPKEKEKKKSIFIRNLYSYKSWLPVGFRSGVLWKMILSIYGYVMIADLSLTLTVTKTSGVEATGIYLWLNRIFLLLMMLGVVMFCGNYCGIRNYLPLMNKNKVLHYLMMVVYCMIFLLLMIILLAIFVTILEGI